MNNSIACFVRGCPHPVIGQCAGYNHPCGRFYCAQHSLNRLCGECGTEYTTTAHQAANQAALEQLAIEYEANARTIVKREKGSGWRGCYVIPLSLLGLSSLLSFFILLFSPSGSYGDRDLFLILLGTMAFLVLGPLILSDYMRSRGIKKEMVLISQRLPHFDQFYKEWKKQQTQARFKKMNQTTMAIMMATGTTIAEDHEAQQRRQAYQNLQDLAEMARKSNRH